MDLSTALEELHDLQAPLSEDVLETLAEYQDEVLPILEEMLEDRNLRRLLRTVEALVRLDCQESADALEELLEHPSKKVRKKAAQGIGRIFDDRVPRTDTILILEERLIMEESVAVENALAHSLSILGDGAGVHSLLRACSASDDNYARRVLGRAAEALKIYPDPELDKFFPLLPQETLRSIARAAPSKPLAEAAKRHLKDELEEAANPFGDLGKLVAGPGITRKERDFHFPPRAYEAAKARLTGDGPSHLLLVGPSGSGKTTLLERLFEELAEEGYEVLKTTTTELLADTKYIGEWQTRLRDLVGSLQRRRAIVYFSDINNLPFSGVYEGSTANFASYLKPFMEEAKITVVGESSPEALVQGLQRVPSFLRLFDRVDLESTEGEVLREQVRRVVTHLALERGQDLVVPPDVLDYLLELSAHFVPSQAFPGRAVWLLDRAVKDAKCDGPLTLGSDQVVRSLAKHTGLPSWLLDDETPLDLEATRDFFEQRVLGQPPAIDAVADLITLIKAGLTDSTRPLGVFLFAGPTGVGKTELAKSLAEFIFGSADRLVRVDMSEYQDYDSYQRLIGSPYDLSNKDGQLTSKIRQQPFSVVLLDEFEKAHSNIYDLMLGLFDDGRLTSARGETVSFCKTIIILTTNLGQSRASGSLGILARSTLPSDRDVLKSVEDYFRPEFVNRLEVIPFRPLGLPSMQAIAEREVQAVLKRSGIVRRSVVIDLDDSVFSLLMREGFTPKYGARPLKRAIERFILIPIARQLVSSSEKSGLIRVWAVGQTVKAKYVVEPRSSFEQTVVPLDGSKWTVEQIMEGLKELSQRTEETREALEEQGLEKEYHEHVTLASSEEFWRDHAAARRLGSRLQLLENLLQTQSQLEQKLEETNNWVETVRRKHNARDLPKIAKQFRLLADRMEMHELRLAFPGTEDQRDAFLMIKDLGSELGNPLEWMLKMYQGWSQRCGAKLTVLGDPPEDQPLILAVDGVQAFGFFKGEHGLHRFSSRQKESRRKSALVRVEVVPAAPHDFRLDESQVELVSKAIAERPSPYGEPCRSWARALHLPTVTVAQGQNALAPEESQRMFYDLLLARVAHDANLAEMTSARSYYLEPEAEVHDTTSGLRSRQLEAVLSGDLLAFVVASQRQRRRTREKV